jgi:hypothetical protein
MAKVSKFIKLTPNILMEWIFDNEYNISEQYKVITNLSEDKKRNFLSTTNYNNINNNLFQLDPVLQKYTLIDSSRYNFLQEQDYTSSPILYDRVKIYLPTYYNFVQNGYIGLYLKIFAYGFYNTKIYELSNIFYDSTLTTNSGLTNLSTPFMYDEQEWGKYYSFEVPSVDFVANQRSGSTNSTMINTINYNLTQGEGLSQTGPIFVNFQYLTSKDAPTKYEPVYYYAGDIYNTSFLKSPEYNTLSVQIEESTEGDFFEIYGTYGEYNENLDNFIRELEQKGHSVRIEYDVYLYEENIQTNFQTFSVSGDDDYTKKIYYRPILTFTNTTAAIKVTMKVIDLVDNSTIERFTSIGLDGNVQKYGKKLMSLNVQNLNKLKIYNAQPAEIVLGEDYFSGNLMTEIIKVNSPQLIEVGKIMVNSPSSKGGYKGMGLLNIVITPFDNIIQFRLGIIPNDNSGSDNFEQYNLSDILNNSEIVLTFKSDTESINKSIYKEASNDYAHGIINFKIVENDLNVLKKIYSKGYTNFYLTLVADKVKTLLYSGTFSFYEDITFVENYINVSDISSETIQPPSITKSATVDSDNYVEPQWPKAGRTVIIYTKYKDTSVTSK